MTAYLKPGAYYQDSATLAEHRLSYDKPAAAVSIIGRGESLKYGATIHAHLNGKGIRFPERELIQL